MTRIVTTAAVLCFAAAAWSAETVSALSAAFSFPSSTGVARPAQSPAAATLACRPLPGGGMGIRWSLGDATAAGSIRLTSLDGRVAAVCRVKGTEGIVALARVPAGVYLATMRTGDTDRTVRAAISR